MNQAVKPEALFAGATRHLLTETCLPISSQLRYHQTVPRAGSLLSYLLRSSSASRQVWPPGLPAEVSSLPQFVLSPNKSPDFRLGTGRPANRVHGIMTLLTRRHGIA
jgi:hypothetical protein